MEVMHHLLRYISAPTLIHLGMIYICTCAHPPCVTLPPIQPPPGAVGAPTAAGDWARGGYAGPRPRANWRVWVCPKSRCAQIRPPCPHAVALGLGFCPQDHAVDWRIAPFTPSRRTLPPLLCPTRPRGPRGPRPPSNPPTGRRHPGPAAARPQAGRPAGAHHPSRRCPGWGTPPGVARTGTGARGHRDMAAPGPSAWPVASHPVYPLSPRARCV